MNSGYNNLLFTMQSTNIFRKVHDKCLLKNEIWRFWKLLAFLKKSFCGHTTPTSITCDWIIHTYGRMWGDRKGRFVQTGPGELLWVYKSCQIQTQKERFNFFIKDGAIISSRNQYLHFWLKNCSRRHKIYFAHRSYVKNIQRPCTK